MKAKTIALILIPLNIILFYFIYNSINSEVDFKKDAEIRIAQNVQKLKDLRQLQVKYKQTKGEFAKDFKSLIYFLENDSIAIVKADGEVPDSLTEVEALSLGIILVVMLLLYQQKKAYLILLIWIVEIINFLQI